MARRLFANGKKRTIEGKSTCKWGFLFVETIFKLECVLLLNVNHQKHSSISHVFELLLAVQFCFYFKEVLRKRYAREGGTTLFVELLNFCFFCLFTSRH